jgi:hypothetical protein
MCGARLKLRRETVVPSSSSSREPRRDFNYLLFGSDDCYVALALQLLFWDVSESMGNHDSEVVDASSVD